MALGNMRAKLIQASPTLAKTNRNFARNIMTKYVMQRWVQN